MRMYKLYAGLNDKDAREQLIPTADALALVRERLDGVKQDATIYTAQGIYTHEDGGRVHENTIVIEIMFTPYDVVVEIARDLKRALNQESIALQVFEMEGALI